MTMKWHERPLDSLHTAYHLFGMIAGTQTLLPQVEGYEHLSALNGSVGSISYQGDYENTPRIVFGQTGADRVVAISGAQTLYMFSGLLDGYTQAPRDNPAGRINPFALSVANRLADQLIEAVGNWTNLLIGGYSYGAILATAMYRKIVSSIGAGDVRCITYGSPKPGDAGFASFFRPARSRQLIQYANDIDPVPYVYPNAEQAPHLHSLVSPQLSRVESSYEHVGTFNQIAWNGMVTTPVNYPDGIVGEPEAAIAGWIAGRQGWNTSGHAWGTYKQRLFMASLRYPDLVTEGNAHLLQASGANNSIEPTATLAQPMPVVPPINSPTGAQPALLPNPINAGRVRTAGDGYLVKWNGIVIGRMRTRGEARRLRNTLKRLSTAQRRASEFQAESVDDALNYQALLEQIGEPTLIR